MLIVLTLLAVYRPETPRRGILQFPTTRGDRLFVSLIGTAFIFILWIRITGGDNLWYPARDRGPVWRGDVPLRLGQEREPEDPE